MEDSLTLHGEVIVSTFALNDTTNLALSFLQDYYYRIHISYSPLNIGNVLSAQIHDIAVWNSYFIDNTLNSTDTVDLDGVTLGWPVSMPHTFTPLENIIVEVLVSEEGSPAINGYFVFNFDYGTAYLNVIGQRAIMWPFPPTKVFTEAKNWLTDVIQIKTGESRYSLRDTPRLTLSYDYILKDTESYAKARTLASNIANYAIASPQWSIIKYIGEVPLGSLSISCDTSYLELNATGAVIVLYENHSKYEILEIDSFTADIINFKLQTTVDFAKCYILPIRVGYSQNGISITRQPKHEIQASLTLDNITNAFSDGIWPETSSYLGYPVLEETLVVTGGLAERSERQFSNFDSDTYKLDVYSPIEYNNYYSTIKFYGVDEADKYRIKRRVDYLKGKYNLFWLPTFNKDLIATLPVSNGINKLYVEEAGWIRYKENYIRVQGNVTDYFQVIGVETDVLFPGMEILLLSPTPTRDITSINRVEVMHKVRADADRIEFSYDVNVMKVSIPVIEVP